MDTVLAYPPEIERALALKTVRDAGARAAFLLALRAAGRDDAEFTPERLQALMAVDEHFQALLLYDQIEYLRQPPPLPEHEREFAQGVQRACLEAANGFQRFLRRREAWAASRESAELWMRVLGLALNAIHGLMKWGYFLGEPGRAAPWKQLHTIFLLADREGCAQAPFVLHPSQPSFKPSVQSLYLRTLLLDLLNSGSLSNIQVEIADGWLASWCADYTLDAEYSSRRHLFFVDLAAPAGLGLIRSDAHAPSVRYVRAEALKAQIEEVHAGLRHGRLYSGHGAGAVFPVEQHVALLEIVERLHGSVIAAADNRIEERQQFEDREVDAIVGFDRVLQHVRAGPTTPQAAAAATAPALADTIEITPAGVSLTSAQPQPAAVAAPAGEPEVERWRVHDLSSHGYGLVVDRAAADAVALNGLIALRNQQTGGWIAGTVVRKLPHRVHGEVLLGVEVLSYRPVAVDLAPAGGEPIAALFLPGADSSGKHDALLVRAGDFTSAEACAIRTRDAEFHIRMNRIIRKGADWIKARFEIEAPRA